MNATQHAPTTQTAGAAAQNTRTLIRAALADLLDLLPLAGELVDTRQRGIGFLTVEARKVMSDLIASERADRATQLRKLTPTERQWFPPAVRGSGDAPAPVGIPAVSLIGEVHDYLTDVCDRLRRRIALDIPVILGQVPPPLPDDHATIPTVALAAHTVELLGLADDRTRFDVIHRQLEDFTARAARLVDGNDVKAHPDPCPHCGLPTLVVYLTDGVIRCERDPHTGNHEPCTCSDSYCGCKTSGRHRHEWHRSHKAHKNTSWQGLRRAQNAATTAVKERP